MTTSGAAAAIAPEPQDGPGPVATADDEVITWAEFRSWERQLSRTGACSRPIRLRGVSAIDLASGEVAGGVLHVACGNRRETACPACSALYKGDARQLVRAGLTGGKGIPESVSAHPCVFATLTAPSFGPVHARRMRGKTVLPCRPRRDSKDRRCPHGRDISCPVRHVDEDPRLGRPLCGDCYDYEAAVLFNFHAGTLFKRFTTYLPRHLARLAGVTRKRLRADLRIRYVKVAEYQARGIIHFHAVIRLDAPGNGYTLPPPRYTAATLCDAITLAARAVRLDAPAGPGRPRVRLGFGPQTKADPIWRQPVVASGQPLDVDAVANYIAKYATKSTDVPGLPDTRIRNAAAIGALRCSAHHKRMIATAWQLGSAKRAMRGCGNGRTCSATAATSSPNPAATPSPSASCAAPAPNTAASSATATTAYATHGAAPSTTRSSWSSTTGPTPDAATHPAPPAHSSLSHPPTVHAAASRPPRLPT